MIIKVTRKDNSERVVTIMFDRASGRYAFVNLTTNHICKCRFSNADDALADLMHDDNVVSFEVIKEYEDITAEPEEGMV